MQQQKDFSVSDTGGEWKDVGLKEEVDARSKDTKREMYKVQKKRSNWNATVSQQAAVASMPLVYSLTEVP